MKIFKMLSMVIFLTCFSAYSMELITFDAYSKANKKFKEAVIEGSLEKVEDALKEGADINFKFDVKVYHNLDFNNDADLYQVFLGNPYKYNFKTDFAIFQAANMGHLDIVKFLVKFGAKTSSNNSNLLFKIDLNNFELFKFLVESGISIYEKSIDEHSRLISLIYKAIGCSALNVVKFLVYHGIDLEGPCFSENNCKKNAIEHSSYCVTFLSQVVQLSSLFEHESLRLSIEIESFIRKHAKRMKNIKNKNLKDMIQKVNQLIKSKIDNDFLLIDLKNLVLGYVLYPTDSEEFFKLQDDQIDELIKVYSEEFEKEEVEKKIKEESQSKCIVM